MRDGFYGKSGDRISRTQWAENMEDINYKRVGYAELENGYEVSTIWLGLDHNWQDGPPLIFETMVFPAGSCSEVACKRYATLEDAELGHARMVKKWSKVKARA